jgi:hypothetical protein
MYHSLGLAGKVEMRNSDSEIQSDLTQNSVLELGVGAMQGG